MVPAKDETRLYTQLEEIKIKNLLRDDVMLVHSISITTKLALEIHSPLWVDTEIVIRITVAIVFHRISSYPNYTVNLLICSIIHY